MMRIDTIISTASTDKIFPDWMAKKEMESLLVREANKGDLREIEILMEQHDMVGSFDYKRCLVADAGEAGLAGFARLELIGNRFYIRPIIVSELFQGRGIGKGLVEYFLSVFSDITVVARGSAEGFYRTLGFSPVGWEEVHGDYCYECQVCPDLDSCLPVPMRIVQPDSGRVLL
jgi:N-acetylglutamate synthase-like GNAT family acetyltransferase